MADQDPIWLSALALALIAALTFVVLLVLYCKHNRGEQTQQKVGRGAAGLEGGTHVWRRSDEGQTHTYELIGVDPEDEFDIFPQPKGTYENHWRENHTKVTHGRRRSSDDNPDCCDRELKLLIIGGAVIVFVLGALLTFAASAVRTSESFETNAVLAEDVRGIDLYWVVILALSLGNLTMIGSFCGCCGAFHESYMCLMTYACFGLLFGLFFTAISMLLQSEVAMISPPIIRVTNHICQDPMHTKEQMHCIVNPTPFTAAPATSMQPLNARLLAETIESSTMSPAVTTPIPQSEEGIKELTVSHPVFSVPSRSLTTPSETAKDSFIRSLGPRGCPMINHLCGQAPSFQPQTSCACKSAIPISVGDFQKTIQDKTAGTYCCVWDGVYCSSFPSGRKPSCAVADGVTCGNVTGSQGARYSDGPCGDSVEPRSAMVKRGLMHTWVVAVLAGVLAAVLILSSISSCVEGVRAHRKE